MLSKEQGAKDKNAGGHQNQLLGRVEITSLSTF